MEDIEIYLDYLRNSREFLLGSKLRQSSLFKTIRHFRLRDRIVRIKTSGDANPASWGAEICLKGLWSEEYPHGMPLEFLERNQSKWRLKPDDSSPFGMSLSTNLEDNLVVYSKHSNLRLDFRVDKFSGQIVVEVDGKKRALDLYSLSPGTLSVFPNQGQIESSISLEIGEDDEAKYPVMRNESIRELGKKFSAEDLKWLDERIQHPQPLSINNPAWRGIFSASRELFGEVFPLEDNLDEDKAFYYAELFKESKPPSITIQGFPHTYSHLVKALHRIGVEVPIYVIWHGNFLQLKENYDWNGFNLVRRLTDEKMIAKVGFVKKGMAEVMRTTGMPAHFVMNYVRRIPEAPSVPSEPANQIGIWAEPDWGWRKPAYAMMAALSLIPDAHAHVAFVSPRALNFAEWFNLDASQHTKPLPYSEVMRTMSRMHLNLYVTLSECAPMLPLESLSLGTPCLLGPTSHYFLDHEYLHSRLVVPYPEHAEVIAEKAIQALAERDEVIEFYRAYAPEYNSRARMALSDFLEFPMDGD